MKLRLLLTLGILFVSGLLLLFAGRARAADSARQPVLVELFTSEGCSSCPPADALLIRLDQQQPIAGAEIIALGQHVDYWNDLGWTDRFSRHDLTERQSAYADRFAIEGPYTPQMVVDGRYQLVGNNGPEVQKALQQAAADPKPALVRLERAGERLQVEVENAGAGSPQVVLAITESGLATAVKGGENGGRQLRHTAVVREWRSLGKCQQGRFSASVPLKVNKDWLPENLRAVVFVQEHGLHEVVGAASLSLKQASQ